MLYVDRRSAVNPTARAVNGAVTITGRNLAHAHRSKSERALTAFDLVAGNLVLAKPTMVQAAELLRVSLPYVYLAARIAGDPDKRRAVLEGWIPLYKIADGDTLAERFLRASPRERLAAARELGTDVLWDTMIEPLLGE